MACRNVRMILGWLLHVTVCISVAMTNSKILRQDGTCSSVLDCSLNGDCVDGKCKCDAGWSATKTCDVLSIEKQPLNEELGYHNTSYSSWGGNVVQDSNTGEFHLFAAQMVLHCELGDYGSNSEIIRATAASGAAGPFSYRQSIIAPFAHNPTIRALPNRTGFVLYMIGGNKQTPKNCSNESTSAPFSTTSGLFGSGISVSFSTNLTGPWSTPVEVNFTDQSPILFNGGTNPSPHIHADGSVSLAFQMHPNASRERGWEMVGIAHASSYLGPFTYNTPNPISPSNPLCIAGKEEDPFLWLSPRGYHIITHGMCPTGVFQAHYRFSEDGVTWYQSPRQTYDYTIEFTNGSTHTFARVERPQLYFDMHDAVTGTFSNPSVLYNGVCNGLACLGNGKLGKTFTLARKIKQTSYSQQTT